MFALRRHSYLSKALVFQQTISEVEKGTKSILSFFTAAITAMVCTFHTYQDGHCLPSHTIFLSTNHYRKKLKKVD